jgi:hypothetical protein
VCTRGSDRAHARGPSTSPLEYATRFAYAAKATSVENQGQDPSFKAAGARAGDL